MEHGRDQRAADRRGESLALKEEKLALSDMLETNDSPVKVMNDSTLKRIAQELVQTVRHNVAIPCTVRESASANSRRMVKLVLRKYGYAPGKRDKANETVCQQKALWREKYVAA